MEQESPTLTGAEDHLNKWFIKSQQISPVRIARLDRKRLIQLYGEWGFKKGAEIGVDRGRFSEFMCKSMPDLDLLCVDPWHWKLRGESRYQSSVARLAPYNCTIVRKKSMEAVVDVPDESLDFVYIDGDHHFDYVMEDIISWARKVKYGGIVSGHDWYRFRQAGVVDAVNVYTKMHGITEWFLTDERTPTFFWIRRKDPWQ